MKKSTLFILAALGLAVYAVASRQVGQVVYTTSPGGTTNYLDYYSADNNVELSIDKQIISNTGKKGFQFTIFAYDPTNDMMNNIYSDTIADGDGAYVQYTPDNQYAISVTPGQAGQVTIALTKGGASPAIVFQKTLNYQGGLV